MPVKTVSLAEMHFEAACVAGGVAFKRLPPSKVPGRQRPDYRADVPACGAFVEVKQIDPNEDDKRQARVLADGRPVAFTTTPGERLRGPVRDAADQLRQASRLGAPTAVAIFDATNSLHYTEPIAVKMAMFGLDVMEISVPRDLGQRPHFVRMKSGGKATLTRAHNTSISAVIIIRRVPPSLGPAPVLLVYLNHFARVPIDETHLRGHAASVFALGQAPNGATDWIDVG